MTGRHASGPQDPLAGVWCALELGDGTLGLSYMLCGHTVGRLQAGGRLRRARPLHAGAGHCDARTRGHARAHARGLPGGGARGQAARKFALDAAGHSGVAALIERM